MFVSSFDVAVALGVFLYLSNRLLVFIRCLFGIANPGENRHPSCKHFDEISGSTRSLMLSGSLQLKILKQKADRRV
jgi:hypothetical protein